MKAKVIIENGKTQIQLTPENGFETDVINNAYEHKKNYEITSDFDRDYSQWHPKGLNHRIELNITEQKND